MCKIPQTPLTESATKNDMTGTDSGERGVWCTLHDRGVMCERSSLPLSPLLNVSLDAEWSLVLSCDNKAMQSIPLKQVPAFLWPTESYSVPLTAGGPLQINTSILWNMSVYGGRVLWVSLNDTHKRCQAMIRVVNDSMEYYLIMAMSLNLIEVQIN